MREVIQSSETFGSNKEQHIEDKELIGRHCHTSKWSVKLLCIWDLENFNVKLSSNQLPMYVSYHDLNLNSDWSVKQLYVPYTLLNFMELLTFMAVQNCRYGNTMCRMIALL